MKSSTAQILYVDEARHHDEFKEKLGSYYSIATASTVDEAIKCMKERQISVIIIDQKISDMKGIEFLSKIITQHPNTMRILITESNDSEFMIHAINDAHIFRYLTKPLNYDELKQSIDIAVQIYDIEKENRQYIYKIHEESLKLDKIIALFKKYIPKKIMNESVNQDLLKLKSGENVNIVKVMIEADLLYYQSQKSDMNQILDRYKNYYEIIHSAVNEYNGYIDKQEGNQTSIIFGAPIPQSYIEESAVYFALDVTNKVSNFNADLSVDSDKQISLKISIYLGSATFGKINYGNNIKYIAIGELIENAENILRKLKNKPEHQIIANKELNDLVKSKFITNKAEIDNEVIYEISINN